MLLPQFSEPFNVHLRAPCVYCQLMSEADYLISTPENVDLHLELAGLGNRVLACIVDTLLTYLLVGLLIAFAMTLGVFIENSPLSKEMRIIAWLSTMGASILIAFSILFGYFIYFEAAWTGQTPGKKMLGIRVVEESGQPITSCCGPFIRNLIRIIDTGLALIGLVVIWIEPKERRLGDLAAGTIVIRERKQSQPHLLMANIRANEALLDVGLISPAEYELALDFLSRRKELDEKARLSLARRLSSYFQKKLRLTNTDEGSDSPESFLENLVRSYQSRAKLIRIDLSSKASIRTRRGDSGMSPLQRMQATTDLCPANEHAQTNMRYRLLISVPRACI